MVTFLPVLLILAQAGAATPPPCPEVFIAVERDGTRHVLRAPKEDLGKQVRLFLSDGTTIRMDKRLIDEKESKRATASASGCPLGIREVVQAEGKAADQLYSAALAWVPTAFKSAKAVTELADKSSGRIVLKGTAPWSRAALLGVVFEGDLAFMITVEVKDGRFRYAVDSFVFTFSGPTGVRGLSYGAITETEEYTGPTIASDQKNWTSIQNLARETTASLAASLKAAMAKPPDNW